jgi:hypothetical protein
VLDEQAQWRVLHLHTGKAVTIQRPEATRTHSMGLYTKALKIKKKQDKSV